MAGQRERERELCRYRGFPDTTFTREDLELVREWPTKGSMREGLTRRMFLTLSRDIMKI